MSLKTRLKTIKKYTTVPQDLGCNDQENQLSGNSSQPLIQRNTGEISIETSENWHTLLGASLESPEDMSSVFGLDPALLEALNNYFHIRINPYYQSLIQSKGDPIYKQVVPDRRELDKKGTLSDPLNEEAASPIPSITHRYPDRVLFLVTHQCAVYCRFCTRRRKVADEKKLSSKHIDQGLAYIREHKEIHDVILSGGDPLILNDQKLDYILSSLRAMNHVEIVRIGTKIPCVLPQRITPALCRLLKKYHPIYLNTHFNHPSELTPEATRAINLLADSGVALGNQTVLLKDINDSPETMLKLMRALLKLRIKPYYLYQTDLTAGTEHFRTRVETGLDIIESMRGKISGLGLPQFVIDLPNGGGKIPVSRQALLKIDDEEVQIKGLDGKIFSYPQVKQG